MRRMSASQLRETKGCTVCRVETSTMVAHKPSKVSEPPLLPLWSTSIDDPTSVSVSCLKGVLFAPWYALLSGDP